jgi:hypothetical protein
MWIAVPALLLAASWVLLLRGVEPMPTWFYVFAWYPTLFLLDAMACRLQRQGHLLADRRLALSLFAWSAPIWLFFEVVNLRLSNWYYIYLPRAPAERWAGILLSFATVVPAVVLAERLVSALGIAKTWRSRPIPLGVKDPARLVWVGWATLAAVIIFPYWLYPLTWGAMLLVADPVVYRRRPEWSLIADLERGEWGRVVRLMLGGVLIGGIWEGYNFVSRAKWIYTVPLLERLKWFEMPPLGFVGFPFFALEAWVMYHALAAWGLAVPVASPRQPPGVGGRWKTTDGDERPLGRRSSLLVYLSVAVLSAATLLGMERWTISSTVPVMRLAGAPELTSPWGVAGMNPTDLAARIDVSPDSARRIRDRAQLIALRGIGTAHAGRLIEAGITSVCRLASQDAQGLWRNLRKADPAPRPTEPEVGVWTRAARRACEAP